MVSSVLLLIAVLAVSLVVHTTCFSGSTRSSRSSSTRSTGIRISSNADSSTHSSDALPMLRRIDSNKILHFEYYHRRWYYPLVKALPWFMRPKPVLKGGMRTFVSTSSDMDRLIQDTFETADAVDDADVAESASNRVALMVYMWVSPSLRGLRYGDLLLSNIITEARSSLRAQYLLIVHDDNGTGKLIRYYQDRGFLPIFDKIDKGMILKL